MRDEQNDPMIVADNLTKMYGALPAVQGLDFSCHRGEIVGFLGPNGAGKTTTMRMLTGYLPPSSGRATIAGYDTLTHSLQARRHLGYLPETVALYPEMRVAGYLSFVGRLRRIPDLRTRIATVLEAVDLSTRADSIIGTLSKGMRQRVGLAQAMIHNPDVLILDEPTLGLDPGQVVEIRELIKHLGRRHTILLSTHILSEVEQLCERVIMIIAGRLRADLPMSELVGEQRGKEMVLQLAAPTETTAATLEAIPGVRRASRLEEGRFRLDFDGHDRTRTDVAAAAVDGGWGLLELAVVRPSLEAVFLDRLRAAQATVPAADEEE